jgi:hypothetical protein
MMCLRVYSREEIRSLLQKAQDRGHYLGPGSYLEKLTLQQLDELLNQDKHDA